HDFDHGGLAIVHLCVDGLLQGGTHILQAIDHDALGSHGPGDAGKALAFQFARHEAAVVEVHLVLLLRTPLAVVEYHGRHGDVVSYTGHDFAHAHAPGSVARIGHGRTVRCRDLGANDGREGVAAVAPAHGGEEAA